MSACKYILIVEQHNGKKEIFRGKDAINNLPRCISACVFQAMLEGIPHILHDGRRMWIECEAHLNEMECIFS